MNQKILTQEQISSFYHDEFVADQVRDFGELVDHHPEDGVVVDIGGGCGFFARALSASGGWRTRVIDMDPASIESCTSIGVEGRIGNALAPAVEGDERVVCFNLILHHLVGSSESATRSLQIDALRKWHGRVPTLFVNEYIYQSFLGRLSPRLIFEITSSRMLSLFASMVARIVPSFKANTFGVGVRFRSHEDWCEIFEEAGYKVTKVAIGSPEPIAHPLRLLLIRTIRRDSYRLEPK
ncbi:class I SAM-dependent methyltransferase [Altererythrobacter arenosus]|uniref:Class I SAM-dependent methyltransferase n=1 Tax=Altererythrobacter arenosus TaxID=3032592 RepID=A0ABY8FUN9_9SPHN|nr:class I SAM-dependent methyltransferase [Altererythrobacter sp. CAU 1644]WFL78718.1 class I SAM-dependent methyltransferase [Altererythrobacter sp. CAU 1644]